MEPFPDILTGRSIDRWQVGVRYLATERYDLYQATGPDGQAGTIGLLPTYRAENGPFRKRFLNECRLAGTVASPNVLRYLGCGVSHGRLWFATEPSGGPSLYQRMNDGWKPDSEQVLAIATQAWRALAAVGLVGLTHRALHPSMLYLDDAGTLRLGGFGLAPDPSGDEAIIAATDLAQPTECLAPEQIRGAPFDGRGDLYAMACVLYWVAAGRPPYVGESPASIRDQHLQAEPLPPRRYATACPPELSTMLLGLLAKAPADRMPQTVIDVMQTCDAMRQDNGARSTTRRSLRTMQVSRETPVPTPNIPPQSASPTTSHRHVLVTILGAVALSLIAYAAWHQARPGVVSEQPEVVPQPLAVRLPLPAPVAPDAHPAPEVIVERRTLGVLSPPSSPRMGAAEVHRLIEQNDHLGPAADLRRRLGDPDVTQDDGGGWWYGDYLFVIEKDFVISAHHRPGHSPAP